MAHNNIMSQFYTSQNLPLREKLSELTKVIDLSGSIKDLQLIFPQLVGNIFAPATQSGWGLRPVTFEANRYEFEALLSFLEPQGPMFRLCYKLLSDPQLKYNLPLNILPIDLQMVLERGRSPQFYLDMLTMDSQSMNVVALALNPFDYYIFNFALYLINNSQSKNEWENWNSVYFALACDYLMHFLPLDPNTTIMPHIPHYTGKVPMAAPLQTANRPLSSPSLLLIPDLSGISNQHTSQTQSRNEVWRSETVLQVFIDLWMNVDQMNSSNIEMYQRNYSINCSSPEQVRIVRVLVKHIHSFSAKYHSDPAVRSSALRKYARQIMCSRAYHYIKHLVMTWPLDASFRLVMELWLSLIQPWRYTDNNINQDRFPSAQRNREEGNVGTLDLSFTQFIAENFPSYTCIFQLILPRFMRLDLSAYKNAVLLFRLGKVYNQQHLVPILSNLEKAVRDNVSGAQNLDNSYNNNSNLDQSYTYHGVALNKWVAIAKQAISELNMSATFEYDPIWSESKKNYELDFVKRIIAAKLSADKNLKDYTAKLNQQSTGFWNSIKHWLMIGNTEEECAMLEEYKKVPNYLSNCINYFTNIFGLSEDMLQPLETELQDTSLEHSSFANSNNFTQFIAQRLNKPADIQYMGDPDLMPIMTHESTILVRILYQMATRLNEMYGEEFKKLWRRNDFWGYVSREVLQKPITIQTFVKDASYHKRLLSRDLPPRLSLRRLGSHALLIWITFGYILFKLLSYSGIFYAFLLIVMWSLFILSKAALKLLRIMNE